MATISSYAQPKVDGKTEKFMFLFRGGDTHVHNAKDSNGQKGFLAGGEPLQTTGKQVN